MTNRPPVHYWNRVTRALWVVSGPSRRLRKLYRELAVMDAAIEEARQRVYCRDHGPTDCRLRLRALRELQAPREALVGRIDRLQND